MQRKNGVETRKSVKINRELRIEKINRDKHILIGFIAPLKS